MTHRIKALAEGIARQEGRKLGRFEMVDENLALAKENLELYRALWDAAEALAYAHDEMGLRGPVIAEALAKARATLAAVEGRYREVRP